MHIPRVWQSASGDGTAPDGQTHRFTVWGWGDDAAAAIDRARERLQRVLERVRRGEPIPERYAYASRPPREEILETFGGDDPNQPIAIVTRNSYGAQVLNTARLLFLDIDVRAPGVGRKLRNLFGGGPAEEPALTALRAVLQQQGRSTFRIYRTASGFRVMCIDRDFDPAGADTKALMQATGTDPAFVNLCLAQRSFRARLTPKPWRCACRLPPGQHPRVDAAVKERFASWLGQYEKGSSGYATCRYLEAVGDGLAGGLARKLQQLHDQITRSDQSLPLA